MKKAFLIAVLMLISDPAFAQDNAEYNFNCSNPMTTLEIQYCAVKELEELEIKREAIELKVIEQAKRRDKTRKEQGLDFQGSLEEASLKSKKAFEPYMEAECLHQLAWVGVGSASRYQQEICRIGFIKERIELLEGYLN